MNEIDKRNAALDLLEKHRSELINAGKDAAHKIARFYGCVTSADVMEYLKTTEHKETIAKVDPRFLGAIFRSNTWRKIGYENKGSHARPISIWELR